MRKTKIVYLDGSQERELIIPQELLLDSEKKEKFIKDHIGNIDYTELRYYDESDDDIDILHEQISDATDNTSENSEPVSELPPHITEVPDSEPPSLDLLTVEIKFHLNQVGYHIIEAGKRLIQAKELVPHGEWLNWLKNNFNLKQRMAYNFMEIAKRFSDSAKLQSIATLGTTQMIALLALPEGEEEKFLALKAAEGNPADQMTVKKLRDEIKKYKDESEHNRNKAGDLEGKLVVAESKLDANNQYITEIKTQLEQRPTVAPPDYEDLQREVKELRERPLEVATEFPSDYESTKQKLAQLEADADNFKRDTALKLSLQHFLKSLPDDLINADNLQSVVNSCAADNLNDFENQLKQLHLICSLLHQHLNTWKDELDNQLSFDRNSIISELQQKMAQDSSCRTSEKIRALISSDGYEKFSEMNDESLLELLKKVRDF